MSNFRGRATFVYDENLVRGLCKDIGAENNPERTEELISLLRAVLRDDSEELRTRMNFLMQKYALIRESKAVD